MDNMTLAVVGLVILLISPEISMVVKYLTKEK